MKNCYIFPSKEERALGLHTNFGASSQCYTDEHAPWGKRERRVGNYILHAKHQSVTQQPGRCFATMIMDYKNTYINIVGILI